MDKQRIVGVLCMTPTLFVVVVPLGKYVEGDPR